MVNKQYNIHNPKPKNKSYTPPPSIRMPIVSSSPNPMQVATNINVMDSSVIKDEKSSGNGKSIYGHNITYYSDETMNSAEHLTVKDLTINDIGRFQYLVPNEKAGSDPDSLYRVSSRSSSGSTQSGKSLSHTTKFWKAGSQTPITNIPRSRGNQIHRLLKIFWRFSKWPIGLLILCALLGIVVYFIVLTSRDTSSSLVNSSESSLLENELSIDFDSYNDIDERSSTPLPPVINGHAAQYPKPKTLSTTTTIRSTSDPTTLSQEQETSAIVTQVLESSTFKTNINTNNLFNTIRTTILSPAKARDEPKITKMKKVVVSTPDTMRVFGFTSGHQNNFGVPIEEDERVLKMLDEELGKNPQATIYTTTTTTTTDNYKTRVSPTLPAVNRYEITTEGLKRNVTDEGTCQSTSLPLCRGILHYDLTTNNQPLTTFDYEHFQYLIDSKCSVRVAEFVCAALEPECRPKRMGTLQPCKRICKAVLEPCAHIIASSEILTATFDCDQYPDSDDRNKCEDPTRRGKCYANEFKCVDQSCIPYQWKCDNIKDCADGEDEENCKFCEQDEFRCLSNDKCIPDKWRCDQYDDCPDASDELDCFSDEEDDYPINFGSANGRTYPYVQEQAYNSQNRPAYLTITHDDRLSSDEKRESSTEDKYIPTAAENVNIVKKVDSGEKYSEEYDEIQSRAASGRAVTLSKNLRNFQDSKEIMMTSDSELDMKYSSTLRSTDGLTTSQLPCPDGQLRCVSGNCITVEQICDKVKNCPDGSDESMCVYEKEQTTKKS